QHLQYSEIYDKSLILKHKELGVMKVSQLSDGIKNMLAMIADIAYRCVLLNGHLGEHAAKQSSGIVMIDEIDMHLHPIWQQSVIGSLQQSFPCIQFIVTTHSPQVLSTVPKESIRVLGQNSEGDAIAVSPMAASYGQPSDDVLQAIMHVDPQPPIPEKNLLDELISLVDQGEYHSSRAMVLLAELKQKLNNQHPQILKIERSIRRQQALK
ncbi:MAG: AAA family ATPase, partial [Plesiomonas sp.]